MRKTVKLVPANRDEVRAGQRLAVISKPPIRRPSTSRS